MFVIHKLMSSSKFNSFIVFCVSSEKRPARGDLIVLVAHNDEPTGNVLVGEVEILVYDDIMYVHSINVDRCM